ncbi:hypothetical protein [Paenibacillus spiritus]|uniref:hypothetical protein n=1 Tax=Paenibacillus spiritus TaxID=2496557 RepID=UPI001CC3FBF9|nr:hypothetical protein [Paenibacillus spiritus]
MRIKVSEHARMRALESNVEVGYLVKQVSNIPNVKGKLRWMTDLGVIVLERVNDNLILIKTFIARYKYKGQKYHRGCHTF